MKAREIKELSTKELVERIEAEGDNLARIRMNHAVSPLDNPQKIKYARKDIARMKTELNTRPDK